MCDDWDDNAANVAPRAEGQAWSQNRNTNREENWSSNAPSFDNFSNDIPSQQFSRSRGGFRGGGGDRFAPRDQNARRYGRPDQGNWRDNGQNQFNPRDQNNRRDNYRSDENREYRSDRKTEVLHVASRHVGRIIGRGGAKINELQSESGAKIIVTKETEGEDTIVKLIGNESAVAKAKELIDDLTTSNNMYN